MASTLFGGSGGAIYMRKVLARAGVHIIFARIVASQELYRNDKKGIITGLISLADAKLCHWDACRPENRNFL